MVSIHSKPTRGKPVAIAREAAYSVGMSASYFELYTAEMQYLREKESGGGAKPSLLLHACCAPCSSAVLEQLKDVFAVTILYYNPNIYPQAEYERRRDELLRFARNPEGDAGVEVIELPYNSDDFYGAAAGLENEKERGERCFKCYELRLSKTADYAVSRGFQYFTTVLSISPHKDAQKINELGAKIEKQKNGAVKFLYADFKKKNGYKRSLELSEQFGLYRQDYCGCEFSIRNK